MRPARAPPRARRGVHAAPHSRRPGGSRRGVPPPASGPVPVDDVDADGCEAVHRGEHLPRLLERNGLVHELPGPQLARLHHLQHGTEARRLHAARADDGRLLEHDQVDRQRHLALFGLGGETDLEVAAPLAERVDRVPAGGGDAERVDRHVRATPGVSMVSQMLWWPLRHHSQLPSPTLNGTRTRSPLRQRVTPGPTSSITPQNSWPRTCGSGSSRPIQLQSPIHRCQSERQMPFASTRTTTPFSGGVGSGTSRTTSGWRMPSMTAALIVTSSSAMPGIHRHPGAVEHVPVLFIDPPWWLGVASASWRGPPAASSTRRRSRFLAAEVGGRDEGARELREKARWYLDVGVGVVWILLPKEREVLVVTPAGESRHQMGERLPPDPRLPGLAPQVDELFSQISAR